MKEVKAENPRETFCLLLDHGFISAQDAVIMCLKYMSQDDVADMMHANELDGIGFHVVDKQLGLNKDVHFGRAQRNLGSAFFWPKGNDTSYWAAEV